MPDASPDLVAVKLCALQLSFLFFFASSVDPDLVAVRLADLQSLISKAVQRWFSIEEAACYSSLSIGSLRRMLSSGKITPYRPVKGKILIDRFQLDAAISSSTSFPRRGRGHNLPDHSPAGPRLEGGE